MNIEIKNPIKLLLLFLLPGVLVTLVYVIISIIFMKYELSGIVKLGVAGLIVMIPVELGIVVYSSEKQYGEYSIKRMILYDKLYI